jgi:hypothetical protein
MSETNGPRRETPPMPSHEPEGGLPPNRPVWGRGRPVLKPGLGVLLLVIGVLAVFALITLVRYNT